ncbi:MAG: nicotinate-nucleotide--dimethylbenzimidazole phosphoribosyltransferase [Dehalococcoidales bacterium]|nr:nicotinate-nucleotide--dimethylbenzimidazole phosphoribosyltransferase [Dehalococcoidales bacterium]
MSSSLTQILSRIEPLDGNIMELARKRQDSLTKPGGSLGKLEDVSVRIAGMRRSIMPVLSNKAIVVMAADHGVVAEGVSAYPQSVTHQMVSPFLTGCAAVNVFARHIGALVIVVDMGVIGGFEANPLLENRSIAFGTNNMATGPAMTRRQAIESLEAGIAVAEAQISHGLDIVGTGDMGIGNTTAASAVCAAITGKPAAVVTGRGTGIDNEQLIHKVEVINRALEINKPDSEDAIDVLSRVGGFEIGGLAGVMLAGAANRIPVVIDGFISGAAALVAVKLSPQVKDYIIASHLSVEPGHRIMLEYLGLEPLLDLDMRLGEGTGAALGITLAEVSVKILNEMKTFDEAGVSDKDSGG